MSKVIGMGNALVDVLTRLQDDTVLSELKFPKGSMQLVNSEDVGRVLLATRHFPRSQASGGSAANTIHGLAGLGIQTAFLGKIGRDEWGDFFRSDLEKRNIKPFLLEGTQESGRAFALISPDSERTFATYLGAAVELEHHDVGNDLFDDYNILHIEGYLVQNRTLIRRALQLAKSRGLQVSLDLASFNVVEENLDFLHEMVENYVDILFANEEEAKTFTGLAEEDALHKISEFCQYTVLKLGERGSLIKNGDQIIKVSAIKANSLDTTGAGDLYAAGFLFGLIHGLPMEKCGQIGSLLAGKVIEVIGPKLDDDTWEEIKRLVMRLIN
ncbi:adenosine kinase [Anaerophaga thermohalophila]|jgi:sugar/nucleoside kinase (ribokinase family)|uniref:adenosine kinase n=1 Tax=Anaerophaga thermohalophila TaxID=177400 RepID=UPI000311E977|nr:adenosine kinase [Anaerophaga thermohalophila]